MHRAVMNAPCELSAEAASIPKAMRTTACAERPSGVPPEAFGNDALLEASRRIDWRFLLPDPNLREVLLVGPQHGELAKSLKLFSAALTVVDGLAALQDHSTQYDTVVLADPVYELLEAAARHVRPSGFLYVEARTILSGLVVWRIGKRMRFVADYLAAVERLGFECAEAHWHWPNFDSCAEIVPLGEPTSLLHALGRRRTTLAARWKTSLCRGLVRLGVFSYFVPCFSLVAQKKPLPRRSGNPLQGHSWEARQG